MVGGLFLARIHCLPFIFRKAILIDSAATHIPSRASFASSVSLKVRPSPLWPPLGRRGLRLRRATLARISVLGFRRVGEVKILFQVIGSRF